MKNMTLLILTKLKRLDVSILSTGYLPVREKYRGSINYPRAMLIVLPVT